MKRLFDILLVLIAMPFWLPVLGIVALTVLCVEGRPVFFRQERAGKGGRPFRMLKLRTMRGGDGTDEERLARRHEVRPGITGWAQVHGRNLLSWEDKFAYDVWYVDHQSFLLDIKILFLTVTTVLGARGIASGKSATMEEFTGGAHGT